MAVAESLILRDLAFVMIAAAAVSLVFQHFKQPTVLGYLVAGVLIGPHVFPQGGLIRDAQSIATLADLGTLFLLFSLGLDFHLGKLRRVGGLAFTSGLLQMVLMVGLGVLAARVFGWTRLDGLFLGGVLAISGGAVIVKVLEDLGRRTASSTQVVLGIVVVERLGGILLIALLSSLALTGSFQTGPLFALLLRLALFVLIALVVGLLVIPRLVDWLARLRVQETLVISILAIAFGLALLSSRLGLSLALGAFIAGALIAESRAGLLVQQRIAPLRDAFVAVFFVAMGLLVNPADLVTYWFPILAISALCILGKALAVGFSTFVAGYPARQSFQVGIAMGMIGGFALVVANLGRDLGVTADFLFPVVLAVTAVTTLVTPFLMRHSDAIVNTTAGFVPERVRRYSRVYVAWVGAHRPGESQIYRALHVPDILRMLTFATLLTSLVVGGALLARRIVGPDRLVDRSEGILIVGVLAVLLLVAVPLSIALVRSVRAVIRHIVDLAVPLKMRERPAGRAAALLLHATIDSFLVAVAAIVLFAAASIFLPPTPLLLGVVAAVAVTAYLLRKMLRRVDHEMDEALDTILADQAAPGTREDLLSVLQDRYDWDLRVEGVVIPRGSPLAYRRIREIALPQHTGASILGLERGGERVLSPTPDVLVEPGDSLTLCGTMEQVEAAKEMLLTEAPPVDPRHLGTLKARIEEIEVLPHSKLAGVPIAESKLREETGVTLVGIRRNGVAMPTPAPETLLTPGDALLVIGSAEQLEAARRRAQPARPSG